MIESVWWRHVLDERSEIWIRFPLQRHTPSPQWTVGFGAFGVAIQRRTGEGPADLCWCHGSAFWGSPEQKRPAAPMRRFSEEIGGLARRRSSHPSAEAKLSRDRRARLPLRHPTYAPQTKTVSKAARSEDAEPIFQGCRQEQEGGDGCKTAASLHDLRDGEGFGRG